MINAMDAPTRSTIREQIMANMKVIFETDTSNDRVRWSYVTREPPSKHDIAHNKTVLGLYDTSEKVREGSGYETRSVNVIVEFHITLADGDKPSTFLNHCLGSIVNRIGDDTSLGGLALNIVEKGSELDIDGPDDKTVAGMIVLTVSYRCRPNDPYTRA